MKSTTKSLTYISLILTALLFSSCGKKSEENTANKVQPVTVRCETLKLSKLVDAIQVAGIVKAYEDVNVSPEEGGVVKEWKVKKGAHVKKGDVIVVLKD